MMQMSLWLILKIDCRLINETEHTSKIPNRNQNPFRISTHFHCFAFHDNEVREKKLTNANFDEIELPAWLPARKESLAKTSFANPNWRLIFTSSNKRGMSPKKRSWPLGADLNSLLKIPFLHRMIDGMRFTSASHYDCGKCGFPYEMIGSRYS